MNEQSCQLVGTKGAFLLTNLSQDWWLRHSTGGEKPTIGFVRLGRRIFFRKSDVLEFLEKHVNAAK